jgi:hypothetical protein
MKKRLVTTWASPIWLKVKSNTAMNFTIRWKISCHIKTFYNGVNSDDWQNVIQKKSAIATVVLHEARRWGRALPGIRLL